jgi:hypothetical protein
LHRILVAESATDVKPPCRNLCRRLKFG